MLDHSIYPETTLFMLMSLDGKISTGHGDKFDFDVDLPKISGLREGLHSYYDIQSETDMWCLVTGKTMSKIGANEGTPYMPKVKGLHRVVVGLGYLNRDGIRFLADHSDYIHFIVNSHDDHKKVLESLKDYDSNHYTVDNYDYYDPHEYLKYLKSIGCDNLTIQSGGITNGAFTEFHLLDKVHVVVAPVIVGGYSTPGLVDGRDRIQTLEHLNVLKLDYVKPLEGSYIDLMYSVM